MTTHYQPASNAPMTIGRRRRAIDAACRTSNTRPRNIALLHAAARLTEFARVTPRKLIFSLARRAARFRQFGHIRRRAHTSRAEFSAARTQSAERARSGIALAQYSSTSNADSSPMSAAACRAGDGLARRLSRCWPSDCRMLYADDARQARRVDFHFLDDAAGARLYMTTSREAIAGPTASRGPT